MSTKSNSQSSKNEGKRDRPNGGVIVLPLLSNIFCFLLTEMYFFNSIVRILLLYWLLVAGYWLLVVCLANSSTYL